MPFGIGKKYPAMPDNTVHLGGHRLAISSAMTSTSLTATPALPN